MKNKIISAILEIKKAGARKIPLGSAEYYAPFEKCFDLMRSGDVTERSSFENFISLAEVTEIETSWLYDLCAELHLVKPAPKYIQDALRASYIIDGLYGGVPWEYYLEHTSLAKIGRDAELLKKVGFEKIPQMLCDILAKMNEANVSSRKEKKRFCEKICLKNKSYIKNIMSEEKNIIEKYIIFQNLLKK